ncbi:MAG: hypothetical protein R3F21_05345 [Myxococcota bacterium]
MAMINCPDCGKEVSSKAPACVACGSPISAQTIQATAKKWKAMQVVGMLLIIFGVAGMCSTISDPKAASEASAAGTTALMFIAGMGLTIFGRLGAWWNHA